jgi:hypothetical protein
MPQFPGIFDTIGRKSLLFAFFNAREQTHESECASPPEPGFARREAHCRKKRVQDAAFRRLRQRRRYASARKEGPTGNQGFPRYNWR